MGAQKILDLSRTDLCGDIDGWLSCFGKRYVRYERYKVGDKPDIGEALVVGRLRRTVCGDTCGLCESEIQRLREYVNKLR